MKNLKRSEKGQTSVEYLLLLVVAISIGSAFYAKMNDFLLKNPNSIISKRLNLIDNSLKQSSGYKRFSIPR